MRAPNTPSLKPSESKAPQERARQNTAEARSTAQVNEGNRSRRTTQTTRLTRLPALTRSADIELIKAPHSARLVPMITKRPRIPARLTAL